MKELQQLLAKEGIKFDAQDNRIPCYPHIINICVSHIVSSLTKVADKSEVQSENSDDSSDENESDDDGYDGEEDSQDEIDFDMYDMGKWLENLKRNPIQRARTVVRTVRSSGQRKEALSDIIKKGNTNRTFHDADGNEVLLKDLQLIRDVRHRWDSLYNMIVRLQHLRLVHSQYILDTL